MAFQACWQLSVNSWHKYQLSVKFLAICQLTVKILVICQLSGSKPQPDTPCCQLSVWHIYSYWLSEVQGDLLRPKTCILSCLRCELDHNWSKRLLRMIKLFRQTVIHGPEESESECLKVMKRKIGTLVLTALVVHLVIQCCIVVYNLQDGIPKGKYG